MVKFNGNTIYENEIETALEAYADEKDIDLYDIGQSRWVSALIYVYKAVFEGTDKLIYSKRNEKNTSKSYDIEAVGQVLEVYVELCLEYSKEINIEGFCRLTGIHFDTIFEWYHNGDAKHKAIYKTLHDGREETLSYKLDSGKNPIGTIAKLNHYYNWNSNGIATDTEKKQNRLSRADLMQIGSSTEQITLPSLPGESEDL